MRLIEFYIVKKNSNTLIDRFNRVELTKKSKLELEQIIFKQFNYFKNEKTPIDYSKDVEHIINSDEIFILKDIEYLNDPKLIDLFNDVVDIAKIENFKEDSFKNIKSFAFSVEYDGKYYLLFQQFKKTYLFFNKEILSWDSNSFSFKKKYFIVLPDSINFYYDLENKTLFFRKSYEVNSTIDLSNYYKDATNSEIKDKLLSSDSIFKGDYNFLSSKSTKSLRRKISFILVNKLHQIDLEKANETAKIYGITLDIQDNKINIPNDKNELDKLFSFFNNDLYTGPFDNELYRASGKRKYK